MMRFRNVCLAAAIMAATASFSVAQEQPPQNTWSRGTTIEVSAGAATASSRTGAALGGGVGWEITPQLALYGSLNWLDRPGRAEAFGADLTVQYVLTPPLAMAPYVKGGVGVHRASFDSPLDEVPEFYRRRLESDPGPFVARTFTDPSFVVGAGARYLASRQWSIQPEVTAAVLRRQARSHVITSVVLRVGYHFEDHPITPSRQRKP